MTATIEKELLEITGVKRNAKESAQRYLKRVQLAVDKLPDDEWDKLSKGAANWANAAAEAAKKNEAIPNFDGEVEDEAGDEPAPKSAKKPKATTARGADNEEDDEPPAKAAKKGGNGKSEKKSAPKSDNGGKPRAVGGIKSKIKMLLIKKPAMTKDQLMEALQKTGEKVSSATTAAMRSEFRHTVKCLQAANVDARELDLG